MTMKDKAVIVSVTPNDCYPIIQKRFKRIVTAVMPNLKPPFKVYIYCTINKNHPVFRVPISISTDMKEAMENAIGNGKVVAEFTCTKLTNTCLVPLYAPLRYKSKTLVCLWLIDDLRIYEKPRELSEFVKWEALSIDELGDNLCSHCAPTAYGERSCCSSPSGYTSCEGRWCDEAYDKYLEDYYIVVPPKGFCYVKELEDIYDVKL